MENKYLKCPICETVQPFEVDFCVYCGTVFDKENIDVVFSDDNSEKGE